MKKLIIPCVLLCVMVLLGGCGKEPVRNYTDTNAPAPAQVSNVQVTPTPGGGVITYKLPTDPNLSYVKAVYELQPGIKTEAKSSIFNDSLILSGFGDVSQREVTIYSVGKNEKESAPLTVSVTPLTPPVMSVQSSLSIEPAFGGVRVRFKNPTKANLALVLLYDSTGNKDFKEIQSFYTSLDSGVFTSRGFDPVAKNFSVYVRDRWNNVSATVEKSITPLFETLIPKNTWAALYLPGDTYEYVENYTLPHVYDGLWGAGAGGHNIFASRQTSPIPQWFTIDLGKKVTASRMKVMHYVETPYSGASIKSFEIWGSNAPAADGSWDSWTKLSSFEFVKPSGLPQGQTTQEDINYSVGQGGDFEFSGDQGAYRYIRFKTVATYASAGPIGQVVVPEITFYGSIAQ